MTGTHLSAVTQSTVTITNAKGSLTRKNHASLDLRDLFLPLSISVTFAVSFFNNGKNTKFARQMASLGKDMLGRFSDEIADKRILAHNNVFVSVYARNCEVRRIDRATAQAFMDRYHDLGNTNCRYRYGLFVTRKGHSSVEVGTMVAAATFSAARKWIKGERTVRSCEWVRFASLPDVRVAGGMGKLLQTFIEEVRPDDVMSYADGAWSDGDVYRKLGFKEEEPKVFPDGSKSLKFRLKLTDY